MKIPVDNLKSVTLILRVRPETRATIEEWRERTGIAATEIAARMVDFFGAQDDRVQQALLDRRGDPVAELVRLKLADMAASGDPTATADVTMTGAISTIRALLDRVEAIDKARLRELQEKVGTGKKKG